MSYSCFLLLVPCPTCAVYQLLLVLLVPSPLSPSVCMTNTDEARECGEFWFLVPPANSSLDKALEDHVVLLLVDKQEYDTKSEVIVYVPTSHVLLHQVRRMKNS